MKTAVLMLYKGNKLTYDAVGNIDNEKQKMTLTYGDTQWPKHLNNLKSFGLCKVELIGFIDSKDENAKAPKELELEIENLLKPAEAELTPEQKRIKDLEEKLEALSKAQTKEPKEQKAKKTTEEPQS